MTRINAERAPQSSARGFFARLLHVFFGLASLATQAATNPQTPGANDTTFNVLDDGTYGDGADDGEVFAMVMQPDGKLIVGGSFSGWNGVARRHLVRLQADGNVDTSFDMGSGPDNSVKALALQPDGKVLIGGTFDGYDGVPRGRVARINPDGSLDSSFATGAGFERSVHAIALQPDGKVVAGGLLTTYDGIPRNRIARLNADGTLDASFVPGSGTTNPSGHAEVRSLALQPDGKILIGGFFTHYDGVPRNRVARANANGSNDSSFDPGAGADNIVWSLALQSDGKVLIAGVFTNVGGVVRNRVARLLADGSLDASFQPSAGADNTVWRIVPQQDGKILVGGLFSRYDNVLRGRIARLEANGLLDASFHPGSGATLPGCGSSACFRSVWDVLPASNGDILIGGVFGAYAGLPRSCLARALSNGSPDATYMTLAGLNEPAEAIVAQPDGKVLVGGNFTDCNGVARQRLARLDANGALDLGFSPGAGADGTVHAIALQPDGRAVIGGDFFSWDATTRIRVARIQSDGGVDASFDPGIGVDSTVHALALQPDGKVLIGGDFTNAGGLVRARVARLSAQGAVDASFDPGQGANGRVSAIALQPDGKLLLGGDFTSIDGTPRNRIARLNLDGSLDLGFDPGAGANGPIAALALQPNGKVLVAGFFSSFAGSPRSCLARLESTGALDASFSIGTGPNDEVATVSLHPDGKILIAGAFTAYNGTSPIRRIARLHGDGSLDTSFDMGFGASDLVRALAIQPDGKLLIVGDFASYNGALRTRIARVHANSPYATYCSGPTIPCPCGNVGAAGNGCANSLNSAGARLAASGVASLANDTLALAASGMPNSSALYFQGTTQSATAFGDGVRCAAGSTIRLGAKTNAAGASSYPTPGDQPVSVRGAVATSGVRHYQVWYRNAALFCTPSTFNLTNGTSVNWAP